jgi:hypothetical protein
MSSGAIDLAWINKNCTNYDQVVNKSNAPLIVVGVLTRHMFSSLCKNISLEGVA